MEESKSKPTKEKLQAAFDAKNVELFTALIEECGEEELALIQAFTQKSATEAYNAKKQLFALSGKFEDMMLVGLKRLVDLSTIETGLRADGVDLRECLNVIDQFYGDEIIIDMLRYRNTAGYSFLYLIKQKNSHEFFSASIHKLFKMVNQLRKEFHAQITIHSDRRVLEPYAKSGVDSFFTAYEHISGVFPNQPEVAEVIFRDIPCNYNLENRKLINLSLPLFKFLVNRDKRLITEKDFYHMLWELMMSPWDEHRIEKIKCLLETFSNGVLDCVELFRKRDTDVLTSSNGIWRDGEGVKVIDFIMDNQLIDSYGFRALYAYMKTEDLKNCRAVVEKIDREIRQSAVTLIGIYRRHRDPQYRHRLLPVEIQRIILSHVADRKIGFERLQRKMAEAILNDNQPEITRLIRDRNMDINQPYEGVAPSFLRFALESVRSLSTIRFLVEQCGARFTVGDLYFCGIYSEKGRYLHERTKKEAVTLLGIFKLRRQDPSIVNPGKDVVQVIAEKVVGHQTTKLDIQLADLPDVSRESRTLTG